MAGGPKNEENMMADGRERDRYRRVILQRSKHPCHQGRLEPWDGKGYAINPRCGDVVEVTLQLSPDGESISSIRHRTDGCAVCVAATDLMVDVVSGQHIRVAKQSAEAFQAMLQGQAPFPHQHPLEALSPLASLPGRSRCASLGWEALQQALASTSPQS